MQSIVTSTQGAFRAALTAGAVALAVAGASLATTAPAEASVRHGGGFHRGGGFHGGFHHVGGFGGARFGGFGPVGYGHGRHFGGYGFRRGIVGTRAFGVRRFADGIGYPAYGYRLCPPGRHFVPGLGCRLNAVYGYRTFGYRPVVFGLHRAARPGLGYGFRHVGHARHFGGHGFGHAAFRGFHGGDLHRGRPHRGGFHHGGGHMRRR